MGSLTPSAVKTFREKGARFIHALTCEEDMGKRKVKNSLPPAALEKKAQSKRTLLNTAKDRPERRSFLYGRSEVIRTPGILLPKQARYQLRYTRLFSLFIRLVVFSQSRRATNCATPGYFVILSGWAYSPKPMSEPSDRHVAPSLALSGTPAVPF